MTSGRMIALELLLKGGGLDPETGTLRSSVAAFRAFAGPYPVHIAKELYLNRCVQLMV